MKNKAIAGYHMLMILSAVDEYFNGKEDKVIRDYIIENFPPKMNLDTEMEILSQIDPSDYPIYFNNAMNDFYMDSTADERSHFIDFAVKLVIADKNITPKENLYLNELYNAWEENYSL
ncbi:MAG: TerB family tellurite resistance protein [Bacteroidetes bacterium]|nr:TerB family tellurite resistance protein [Bacteroidota bacterium]